MDEFDEIKKELEEIRRLKENLKAEIEEIRRERFRQSDRGRRVIIEPPKIDLSGLTKSLDEMMENIQEQIRASLRGVDRRIETRIFREPMRRRREAEIESIPPERVARVISPLGSEERLKILDYLNRDGGKTFNELEEYMGRVGSSLTHHLQPLIDAGYVIKGEVRGTYYITVEGRLAYRLAQWLTSRLEHETTSDVLEEPDKEPEELDREDDEARRWL